jgi:minor extracellular protease Epr
MSLLRAGQAAKNAGKMEGLFGGRHVTARVAAEHPARTAVQACVGHGVVQGYDDGLYRPDAAVTREQMAVYVARAFELPM